jgi:chromosome segregation ATPase
MEPEPIPAVLAERLKGLEERLTEYQTVQLRERAQAAVTTRETRDEVDRRLLDMNELRRQIETERGNYVSRAMLDARIDQTESHSDGRIREIAARLEGVVSRLDVLDRLWANLQGRLWALGVGLTVMVIVLNLMLKFIWK